MCARACFVRVCVLNRARGHIGLFVNPCLYLRRALVTSERHRLLAERKIQELTSDLKAAYNFTATHDRNHQEGQGRYVKGSHDGDRAMSRHDAQDKINLLPAPSDEVEDSMGGEQRKERLGNVKSESYIKAEELVKCEKERDDARR